MDNNQWLRYSNVPPGEAAHQIEGRMARGGISRSDYGKIREAQAQINMPQTQEKLASLLGSKPPMTGEMIRNSSDYENYMDHVMNGSPLRKNSMFGGFAAPTAAQGGIPVHSDPLNSQTRWGIPTWREETPEEDKKEVQRQARSWCRWYYHNHPVVPTCMDIYAKYPFVGLDLQCPDPAVEDEYKSMFFDMMNYEKVLPDAALHYWINGESGMLAQWDDSYKGWVEEQVINSDDIDVLSWPKPIMNKEAYLWYPPEDFQQLINSQDMNSVIYHDLVDQFGEELLAWGEGYPSELPGDVFSLLRFRSDLNGNRGYPILMRAFGQLMMEEKLNQAMTAVADRLYTPFIVVKLGGEGLLANGQNWIPSEAQMKQMQAQLEMVMISKYRLMVYHSGITFENPFAGQTIPNLESDFDRITQNILNVFGISKELIMGGSSGTYASGALSAEIMMQQLAATQHQWTRWWIMDRAKKVAEARGYYELERKGNTYTKPMERVREYDPVKRQVVVRERRKLMLPSVRMETMDWRDQETKVRGLMELRRQFDVPITDQKLVSFYDTDLDIDVEREGWAEERRSQYEVNQSLGLAAPQQRGMGGAMPGGGAGGMGGGRPPGRPTTPGGGPPATRGPEDLGTDQVGAGGMPGPGDRPAVSDDARATMPTAASLHKQGSDYITVSDGNPIDLGVSELESKKASENMANRDPEQINKNIEKTAERKSLEARAEESYKESIGRPLIFRKTGKQKGTLYFMRGNRLMAAPTK